MIRTKSIYLALLAVLLSPMAANADIIMTITDDGTDLTMTATGTYDNTGLEVIGNNFLGVEAAVAPTSPLFGWETGFNSVHYAASYSGTLTGTANDFLADLTSTTNPFFFWQFANRIVFNSGSPLTGAVNESATFFGTTLASLGMVSGESISVTWGNNTGTIQTFAANSVPEPGTLALLGLGLVGMAARRRKV